MVEFDDGVTEDELLRVITLLANIVSTGQRLKLSPDLITSLDDEDDDLTGDGL